ncbi:MAG TPA: hypothetical protein K8W20_22405 [Pseudomonas lactis]|uniref:Uncharacterized protein n=1 Tax=Pseudomonas lactis TaxID=1615674 RepID=A0A921NKF0_9PSED|nr:hypothetical protein [Pseudomonas lactis]HJH21442.1 hypothetical protein [Pseudomonas lactis]
MSTEKMREEFEAWWAENMNTEMMDLHRCSFPLTDYVEQPYACHETGRGWMSWQASRADIEVDLTEVRKTTALPDRTWLLGNDVVSAIESLGLKVKP